MAYFHQQLASGTAIIVAALLAVGCGRNQDLTDWWQGEQLRIELSQQLALKQYRFEQAYLRDFEQLEKLRRSTTATVSLLKLRREQRLTLGGQIESLEGQWADFRESTIRDQRQIALRKTFEKLTVVSGRTFAEASVVSIDDSGVTIRHADGSARLRYADLDAKQRIYFGLEADRALAAELQEARDAAVYERWVGKQMVALDETKLKDSENARNEELAARQTRTEAAALLAANSNARPLAQPATSVGNRSWSYSSAYSNYRASRPTYRYVYYNCAPAYTCQPSVYPVYPGRAIKPDTYTSPVVPKRKSFADTTIPSIP